MKRLYMKGLYGKGLYLKGLLTTVVVLILLCVLMLWWPLRMWAPWLNQQLPPGWRIEGVTGSLWSGEIGQLMILGTQIGPWQWQLEPWSQRLHWQLGTSQAAPWTGHIDWLGADRWRLFLTGGDLQWVNTRLWGLQFAGVAHGQLDITGAGEQCLEVHQGDTDWTPLKVIWPRSSQGQFQQVETTIRCRDHGRWSLEAVVKESGVLNMMASGRQLGEQAWMWSLEGWMSPEPSGHPVAESLRPWLSPDPQGAFEKHFRAAR